MDATPIISADLDSLLDDVQQRTFRYFWDGAHPQSGLPYDKCLLDGTPGIDAISISGTGFGLMNDLIPLSPNPRSFFWGGWGGSIAVTDVDAGLTVSYVMNRMADALMGDLRGAMLVIAAYEGLAAGD